MKVLIDSQKSAADVKSAILNISSAIRHSLSATASQLLLTRSTNKATMVNLLLHRGPEGDYVSAFGYDETKAFLATRTVDGMPVLVAADRATGTVMVRIGDTVYTIQHQRLAELVYKLAVYLGRKNAEISSIVSNIIQSLADVCAGMADVESKIAELEAMLTARLAELPVAVLAP